MDLNPGDFLDYWCEDEHAWSSAKIIQLLPHDRLLITVLKNSKELEMEATSRRLAKHHYFTKEDSPQAPAAQGRREEEERS